MTVDQPGNEVEKGEKQGKKFFHGTFATNNNKQHQSSTHGLSHAISSTHVDHADISCNPAETLE